MSCRKTKGENVLLMKIKEIITKNKKAGDERWALEEARKFLGSMRMVKERGKWLKKKRGDAVWTSAQKRIQIDLFHLGRLDENTKTQIYAEVIENKPMHITGWILGPKDTIFEGKWVHIRMHMHKEYPFYPPKIWIQLPTTSSHPIVGKGGQVHIPLLKQVNWTPTSTISSLLIKLRDLLSRPTLEHRLI